MRSPLRSKRPITSPVRARSKASGLTRIRVRLTAGAPLFLFGGRRVFRRAAGAFAAARSFRFGGGAFTFAGVAARGVGSLFFTGATRATLRRDFLDLAVAFALPVRLGRRSASAAAAPGGLRLPATASGERRLAEG